jgi:exopolysaccharide biosynthesis polyprenyl glycosylphosphotransferase
MKKSEIAFDILRVPTDFFMVILGFIAGYKLRLQGDFIPGVHFELNPDLLMPAKEFTEYSIIFAALLVIVFALFGLYSLKNTDRTLDELKKVTAYSLVWILVMLAYFFIVREIFFSRLVLGFSVIITILLLITTRIILNQVEYAFLNAGIGQRKVLLIGANKITKQLAENFIKDPHYKPVGYLSQKSIEIPGLKKLGSLKELKRIVRKYKVEELIQTSQDLTELEDHEILAFCQENHLEYRFVPDILEVEKSNIEIRAVGGFPLIHLKPTPLDGWGKVYKRIFDFTASGLGLIILSPLLLLIAIIIKFDSRGPILFSRLDDGSPAYRIGQKGRRFKFYKFRTMKDKCHSMRYEELAEQNARSGPLVKIKNDPRITRFGRFLRKTSVDELPQLWNVLVGNMSLVGPRPHLPEEVEKYEDHQRFLLTIKPGITGLSQISGRSDLAFEEEVSLDSFYIKHWSPFFDLKILFKTIFVLLKGYSAD